MQFFTTTLDFAVFPHETRRPHAEALGVKLKLDPSIWAPQQVRGYLQDPERRHAGLIDKVTVAFSKVFQRVWRRRCPASVTPPMPVGLSALWRIVCMRRMVYNNWDLIPPRDARPGGNGNSSILWKAVAR